MIGMNFKHKYNSHVELYLPFTNDLSDKTGNHTITNSGVSIRLLSDYSIPDCPNGAKYAAFFDGSSYIYTPYTDKFNWLDDDITCSFWIYVSDVSVNHFVAGAFVDWSNYFYYQNAASSLFYRRAKEAGIDKRITGGSGLSIGWNYVEINMSATDILLNGGNIIVGNNSKNENVYSPRFSNTLGATYFRIGESGIGSYYMTGYLSEFMIKTGNVRNGLINDAVTAFTWGSAPVKMI